MDQPPPSGEAKPNKGGRPFVVPDERSLRIGPFRVNESLAKWLQGRAAATGLSQGALLREALVRLQRATRRGLGRKPAEANDGAA